ncbi:MAG: ABC transporter permease [Chloroflexi bacterium]|nr:ABC transporter permease [Chloroflexota bacterium]
MAIVIDLTSAPLLPMLWMQIKAEFLKLLRVPFFSLFSLAFPVVLYCFFGLPNATRTSNGTTVGAYVLASMATYGVVSVMMFSFGIGVANERAQRMQVLMRATPLPGWVYLSARVVTALAFALVVQIVLDAVAVLAGGVSLSSMQWVQLTVTLLLGSLPFIAFGFGVGYRLSPSVAAPAVNLVFLVLSFASGLFVPLSQVPQVVQNIAPYLPTYHLGRLAWDAIGASTPNAQSSVLWLAAYGVGFVLFAVRAYGAEQSQDFG